MVKALPFSQLLQARLITVDESKWVETVNKMTDDFLHRGFPPRLINVNVKKVGGIDVSQARCSTRRKKETNRLPFVITYSELSPRIAQAMKKHWHILKDCFPQVSNFKCPPLLAYRRNKSH